ncbi:MAG: PQQ-binding-like beta-propeller repeat protein, partial [Spirochaetota bacterium]
QADQKKREETKPWGYLTVMTPVKNSVIKVDGKIAGRGTATVKVQPDQAVVIEVTARDFENNRTEVTLQKDEKKSVEIALVSTKLKDRVAWTNPLAGGLRGDIIFYNSMIISAVSNGTITAMDQNGAVIWRSVVPGGFESAPAIADGRLYAVTKKETLHSLNPSNGKILWTQKISGTLVFGSSPVVADGNVIVATNTGKIYSFTSDGKENWMKDLQTNVFSTPALSGDKIFVGADDHSLYAVSVKKGKIEWKTKLDGRVVSSAPAVSDGKVYIGTFAGSVYSVNMNRGTIAWSIKTGGPVVSSPVCVNDRIYIGSKDSKLYSLDKNNGKIVWSLQTASPITSEIAVLGNEIYALSGRSVYS